MATRKSFLLRLDPDTFEAVQRWANDELRSVNGQVEFLLRRALLDAGRIRPHDRPHDVSAGSGDGDRVTTSK